MKKLCVREGGVVGGIDYSSAGRRLQIRMEQKLKPRKRFDTVTDQFLQFSRIKICPSPYNRWLHDNKKKQGCYRPCFVIVPLTITNILHHPPP